ncbi:MAG TPA: hypothetical protein VFF39_07620 [Verrucomicrobiae bacterium]|nr:hypothetical protein [Verrucomicrobiae bacterium]
MGKAEPDPKGPREFISFARELPCDEFFLVSIVIGVVFGFVWLLREIFRICFGE